MTASLQQIIVKIEICAFLFPINDSTLIRNSFNLGEKVTLWLAQFQNFDFVNMEMEAL